MKKPDFLFLLVVAGFAVWWLPSFGTYGLFCDGLGYGCISRNWAFSDDPNIWLLVTSSTIEPQFNGHPPFAFWTESLLFKLLGDHFWIEHLYGLIMAVLTAFGIYKIWQKIFAAHHPSGYKSETAFLGIALWLMIPLIGWSYSNNMLENTLCALTLFATLFLIPDKNQENNWLKITVSGLLIFAATLTKGPVGLFPLAVIIMHWIAYRTEKLKTSILKSIYLTLVVVMAYALLIFFSDNAKQFLIRYVDVQLYGSIIKQNGTSPRGAIIENIILEPLIALALVTIGWLIVYKDRLRINSVAFKAFCFFALITLCIVVPLSLSPKQMSYYIVPALPFLSLALAVLFLPVWIHFSDFLNAQKWLRQLCMTTVAICITIMIYRWGSVSRDKEMLADVFEIKTIVPPNDTIGITSKVYERWSLHGYLNRFGHIDLFTGNVPYKHWLLLQGEQFDIDTSAYKRYELKGYVLYSVNRK